MRYRLFLLAAVMVSAAATGPANAQCSMLCPIGNAVNAALCQLNPGPQSVQNCIATWDCIHQNYPGSAGHFVNGKPPPKCRYLFKPER